MRGTVGVLDPKGTREALCAAQSALNEHARRGMDIRQVPIWTRDIQDLINEIDKLRPLGSDGKHGERHTAYCGCEF
jgi:hypothetical protein